MDDNTETDYLLFIDGKACGVIEVERVWRNIKRSINIFNKNILFLFLTLNIAIFDKFIQCIAANF